MKARSQSRNHVKNLARPVSKVSCFETCSIGKNSASQGRFDNELSRSQNLVPLTVPLVLFAIGRNEWPLPYGSESPNAKRTTAQDITKDKKQPQCTIYAVTTDQQDIIQPTHFQTLRPLDLFKLQRTRQGACWGRVRKNAIATITKPGLTSSRDRSEGKSAYIDL